MDYGERDKTRWASSWTISVCLPTGLTWFRRSSSEAGMAAPGKSPGKTRVGLQS